MSSLTTQQRASKTRDYRLGKRAEKQEETRNRIIEAAVELHSTLGPARTTVSQIAERAGVQRHTYYAHFPDERELFLACSALSLERDPLPDNDELRALAAGRERVLHGLERYYDWYRRNAELVARVLRDAEGHALTSETVELRWAPIFREAEGVLGEGLGERPRALLGVALGFACWRALADRLNEGEAVELMGNAIASA